MHSIDVLAWCFVVFSLVMRPLFFFFFFFFNDTATTGIYTLSLHDALPIWNIFFSSATAAFRGSAQYPHYAVGKFGLRALSQSLAKAYAKDGVHVAHMRLDLDLDVPLMRAFYESSNHEPNMVDPDDVAQAFWLTHQQPKTAWSNEVELRPFTEAWTY